MLPRAFEKNATGLSVETDKRRRGSTTPVPPQTVRRSTGGMVLPIYRDRQIRPGELRRAWLQLQNCEAV